MSHRYGLARSELEQLSVALEDDTGFDSIPTVERLYDGVCCFPDCEFHRSDPAALWEHVHFSRKHGLSFEAKLPDLIQQRVVERL